MAVNDHVNYLTVNDQGNDHVVNDLDVNDQVVNDHVVNDLDVNDHLVNDKVVIDMGMYSRV